MFGNQFLRHSPFGGFGCLFPCYAKLMRKRMHLRCDAYTIKSESNGKKASIKWEKHEHQFPRFSPTMTFVAFSCTMGNWWGNPCISHMKKYTVGLESYEEKSPIVWEKYEYQFPRLSPYHGFYCIFPYSGKFMGKPMHFPYDDIG